MHDKKVSERCDSFDVLEASSEESDEKEYVTEVKERKISKNANLLRNWPLMSVIIVYCVFSLQEIAYAEVSWFPFSLTLLYYIEHLDECT